MLNYVTKLHYGKLPKAAAFALSVLFFVPSVFYSLVIRTKNLLYKFGVLKENKAPVKVICIGNLTTGGVGKTPVVIEFCKYLTSKGIKTASLSRGYGGKGYGKKSKKALIVKDYEKILINDPKITGDEVNLIAKTGAGFGVIASRDRMLGAKAAKEELNADVIVMDDGFSNRKIKKDLTLILFDTEKFIGNGFMLPLGPLREPVLEIKRADGIILIDKGNAPDARLDKLRAYIETRFQKPVFVSKFNIDYFYDTLTCKKIDPRSLGFAVAFSGIGQPEQFYNYLKPNHTAGLDNINLLGTETFDDHHSYTKTDIENIIKKAESLGAEWIITTQKDEVKIKPLLDKTLNSSKIVVMKLKPEINVAEILDKLAFETTI